jgi:conjugal transfer/entry exclusion protein
MQITRTDLNKISALLKTKEKLLAQVGRIDSQLGSFNGSVSTRRAPAKPARSGRKASVQRRGQLKEKIIGSLKAAGKQGLSVKEVAAKVKSKEPNVRVWFFTTGKKVKEIKRVGKAKYSWAG